MASLEYLKGKMFRKRGKIHLIESVEENQFAMHDIKGVWFDENQNELRFTWINADIKEVFKLVAEYPKQGIAQ